MQSNGSTIDYDLIERLQRDLYKPRHANKQKVSVRAVTTERLLSSLYMTTTQKRTMILHI